MSAATYAVTVTPKYTMHAGSWTSAPYTVLVYAKDRASALRKARGGYEDSKENPASFRARVATQEDRDRYDNARGW